MFTTLGFKNLKMNSEALEQITKHVQFITFHREDANKVKLNKWYFT